MLSTTSGFGPSVIQANSHSPNALLGTNTHSDATTQTQVILSGSGHDAGMVNSSSVATVQNAINGKLPADPRNALSPSPDPSKPSTTTTQPGSGPAALGSTTHGTGIYYHDGVTLGSKVGPVSGVWSGLTSAGSVSPSGGGTGPGGGIAPAQIAGAYGLNMVMFGSIVGDGTGQTIALVDNGDNPGFLNSSDPNYATSALAQFDAFYGIPQLPSFSFQKYDQNGSPTTGVGDHGWGLEIALDVEWAHAMAPGANMALVEGNTRQLRRPWCRTGERGRGGPRQRRLHELRGIP